MSKNDYFFANLIYCIVYFSKRYRYLQVNMTIQADEKKTISGTVCKMYVEHGVCTWGTSCKFEHPPKKAGKNMQKTKSTAPKKANTNNKAKTTKQFANDSAMDHSQQQHSYQPYISTTDPYFGNPYGQMLDTYGVVYGNVPQKYTVAAPALHEQAMGDKPIVHGEHRKHAHAAKQAMMAALSNKTVVNTTGITSKLTNQELYNTVRNETSCEKAIAMVATDVADMSHVPVYYTQVQKYLASGKKNSIFAVESMWLYNLISLHVMHAIINHDNLKMLALHCVNTIQAHRNGTKTDAVGVCQAVACIRAIGDYYVKNYQF